MAWRETYFCEFEDCGKTAQLGLKAHTRSDSLLVANVHWVCKAHWYEPVRDVINLMVRDDEVTGLSVVLP